METMGLLKQKYLDTPKNICKLAKVFEPNRIPHLFSEATRIKTSSKQQMWQVNPKPEEWTLSSIFSQSVLGGGTTKLYSRIIVQFHYMEEV